MQQKSLFKFLVGIPLVLLVLMAGSCRKDFSTEPSEGQLRFSKDTVYLDTVFSNISSSTYRLTVYNDRSRDISIPTISLGEGENSHYRLNVDGMHGKSFRDVEILARDSILIYIETTTDLKDFAETETQFLYTDKLQFDEGPDRQNVELVTLIQDAHFLYPERFDDGTTETLDFGEDEDGNPIRISGFFLDDSELHFTNEKPYVIYGWAAVPPFKTLTVDPGTRIHFHQNGGLIVANKASLHVNGELSLDPELLENEVIFQGDRLEPGFKNIPGQWQAIWLTEGSTNNIINHATIKNGTAGIRIDSHDGTGNPTLKISNTQIYNFSTLGIWALTGNVEGKNLAINNCGQAALYLSLGGTYNFYNSTFANYWSRGFRDFPSVLVSNYYLTPGVLFISDLIEANFYNCIIYGNNNLELILQQSEEADFNYNFENSLIKFNDYSHIYDGNPLYDFEDETHYKSNIFNKNPEFLDFTTNKLNISDGSPAKGLANPNTATPTDILGRPRGSQPDSGAYESEVFEESL